VATVNGEVCRFGRRSSRGSGHHSECEVVVRNALRAYEFDTTTPETAVSELYANRATYVTTERHRDATLPICAARGGVSAQSPR
jgi:hypothetical protein